MRRHVEAYQLEGRRLGPVAASHNRLLRYQLLLEQACLPIFPHALEMARTYWEALLGTVEPEPGLIELLQGLKRAGIRIGVGTNMTALMQFQKLYRLGLTEFVDTVVTSEEVGVEKPEPGFFSLCQEKALCLPEETVFIGDNLELDVRASIRCGMHGVYYSRYDTGKEAFDSVPSFGCYRDILTPDGIRLGEGIPFIPYETHTGGVKSL